MSNRTNLAAQRIAQSAEAVITAMGPHVRVSNGGLTLSTDAIFTGVIFMGAETDGVFITGSSLTAFWAPRLAHLQATCSISTNSALARVELPSLVSISGSCTLDLSGNALTALSLPALTTIDTAAILTAAGNTGLTVLALPALATMNSSATLNLSGLGVTSLSLPALSTINSSATLNFSGGALTSFSVPALSSIGTVTLDLSNNALPAAAIQAVLQQWVTAITAGFTSGGTVALDGGSNAAPLAGAATLGISAAGVNYAFGETITASSGTLAGVVDSVDGDGAILHVTMTDPGTDQYDPASLPTLTVNTAAGTDGGVYISATATNSLVAALRGRGVTVTTN